MKYFISLIAVTCCFAISAGDSPTRIGDAKAWTRIANEAREMDHHLMAVTASQQQTRIIQLEEEVKRLRAFKQSIARTALPMILVIAAAEFRRKSQDPE